MEIDLGRVLDALPAMVWTALPDGHIDFVNRRWSEYTGLSLDEAHGWDWQAAVDPDDLPKLLERWRSILASGEPGELEARVRRFDGQYRWYLVHCNPMFNDAGRIVKWCGTATDVNDFRRAEETLRRRELDFRLIVDSIPIPVAVTTPSGEVEGLNQPTLDYFGKTFEELKGWKASEVVHPDDLERTMAAQLEAHQRGHSYNVESRHRRADGVYRWYNVLGLPLRDPQGRILRWFHLLIDIDDRKQAEEALRQSEAQLAEAERDLRLTIDTIPVFVSAYQPDGTRSFVNRTWQDYMGLTLEEVTGEGATTFPHFHPDDAERNDKAWRASLASGEPLTIEVRLRRADGQYRWHKSLRVPLRDEKGRIVRWYSVSIDIDDQKRAEEALVASEREARLIVNSIPAGIEILGPTGKVEAINEHVVRYFGRTSEELKRRGIADFIHPEDLQNVLDTALHSTTTGAPYDAEQRFRGADGTYRWFQVRGLPLRDVTGSIVRWYALHIDIDDRKRAEDALLASERQLDLIINTIPALAWSARPDGTAEFFNQHYLDYIGFSAEQAQGWGWTAAAHPDDLNGLATTWQTIMASGKLGEAEARLRRHDGEYRWFLFRANPLRDETGSIVKWYGLNTDIEDRKRAEEALSESERYSRLIVDSIPATVTAHTPDGELEFANRQVLEYFGKTLEEIKHWKTDEITHPEDLPRSVELFSQSMASGAPFDFEVRARRFDGVYRWLQTRGLPLRDADGRIVRWYNLLIDIDERKRAEEALSKAHSELAHVARVTSLGALTASIAHEVNQPLSGIITNASTCLRMLAADPPNIDVAQETARRTIRDGNRAADVIARLRALFSRKTAAFEPVDLNEAVREVIALSWGDLQRSRVVLRTELADGLPPVGGDRIQLQQVMMNLLRNAADAMSEIDDRPRRVVIRTDSDSDGQVRLSVEDNGVGFGPDGTERLFETFYTTKSDGMGIGLSVSRSIIESHRGRLWAVSNDGPGATFSFSIPGYSGEKIPVRGAGAMQAPVTSSAQNAAGIS